MFAAPLSLRAPDAELAKRTRAADWVKCAVCPEWAQHGTENEQNNVDESHKYRAGRTNARDPTLFARDSGPPVCRGCGPRPPRMPELWAVPSTTVFSYRDTPVIKFTVPLRHI